MVPVSGTGQIKTGGTGFPKPVAPDFQNRWHRISKTGGTGFGQRRTDWRPALGMVEGRAREGRGGCRDAYPVLSLREEGRRREIDV